MCVDWIITCLRVLVPDSSQRDRISYTGDPTSRNLCLLVVTEVLAASAVPVVHVAVTRVPDGAHVVVAGVLTVEVGLVGIVGCVQLLDGGEHDDPDELPM